MNLQPTKVDLCDGFKFEDTPNGRKQHAQKVRAAGVHEFTFHR